MPEGSATPDAWSTRPARGLTIVIVALLGIGGAGLYYLHSASTTAKQRSVAPPSTSRDPVTYSFVTPMIGWALVNPTNPASPPAQFHVYMTRDGAQHWDPQFSGDAGSPGFVELAVRLFNGTYGFMVIQPPSVGDIVYQTGNGGDTWEPVALPSSHCVVVTFSDFDHGFALAQDPAEPTTGQLFDLYATADRGTTWQRLANPPHDAYYFAARSTDVWMGSLGPGIPHVYVSTDAGQSWQRRDLPPPPDRNWNTGGQGTTVTFLSEHGVVVTSGVITAPAAPIEPALFTSFDSGLTWRYVAPPPGEVAFQDAFQWWAVLDTTLWKSADAGQSWTEITGHLKWQMVPQIIDSRHAWAPVAVVGGFGLALTDDGGSNWRLANAPNAAA